MIETGDGLVQVNIPPEMGDQSKAMIGQEVTIQTKPEPKVADHPPGDHPVFKLGTILDADGKATAFAPRDGKPHHGKHDESIEVEGTVERLNYAKHGEANGVVLDTGDFVHLKPDGMKQLGLKVGRQVTAQGKGGPSAHGGKAFDAEIVNGTKVAHKKGSGHPRLGQTSTAQESSTGR